MLFFIFYFVKSVDVPSATMKMGASLVISVWRLDDWEECYFGDFVRELHVLLLTWNTLKLEMIFTLFLVLYITQFSICLLPTSRQRGRKWHENNRLGIKATILRMNHNSSNTTKRIKVIPRINIRLRERNVV